MFSVVPAGTSAAPENDGDDRSLRVLQQQGRELIGHVERHIMPACKLLQPPAALSCLGVKLAEGTIMATRQNVSDVCDAVAGAAEQARTVRSHDRSSDRGLPALSPNIHGPSVEQISRNKTRTQQPNRESPNGFKRQTLSTRSLPS